MESIIISLISMVAAVAGVYWFTRTRINNVADHKNLKKDIDREVAKIMKDAPKQAVMVGVYKQGTCYFKSEGHFSSDLFQLPDEHSVFQVGSLSKLFTASILHSLVDDGVVTMETTLGEIMGEKFTLSEDAQTVTLQQLVTHTSGFPRVPQLFIDDCIKKVGQEHVLDNPYSHLSFNDVTAYLETSDAKKAPGKFNYSNFGSGLLGHALEIASGKDLDTLAKEIIFTPLAMSTTGIKPDGKVRESIVQGYTQQGKGAQLWKFGALAGAGAFYSTAADMMSYVKSYLAEDGVNKAPLTTDGGWMAPGKLENFYGNKTAFWHNGKVGGYASYAAVDKENDTAIIALSAKAEDLTMLGVVLMRHARTQSWDSNES